MRKHLRQCLTSAEIKCLLSNKCVLSCSIDKDNCNLFIYILLTCCNTINRCLVCVPFGFVLRTYPQQGQCFPSQLMKISHCEHLFCPFSYLLFIPNGFPALYLVQVPLQTIVRKSLELHYKMIESNNFFISKKFIIRSQAV